MLTNAPHQCEGNSNGEGETFGARILALADRLARFSETSDGLTCTFMTPAHRATAAELGDLMASTGMAVHIDAVGNVVGRYASGRPDAPALVVGSHYDTVRNAGKYDGRLGILAGIVAVEEMRRRELRLPFHLDLIAFSEEEGVRFLVPYIGSTAVAGRFKSAWLDRRDVDGQTLAEVLRACGSDPSAISTITYRGTLAGYIEVHIEQGPVLLHEGLPLGIVEAIAGIERYRVSIRGVAGHAGTVPMELRHDAVAAAAEIILLVERRCSQAPGLRGTVGQLSVPNGAINVIPGRCEFSLDIRAGEKAALASAVGDVVRGIEEIAARRRIEIETEKLIEVAPVACAPRLRNALARAMAGRGIAARELLSGAGHDAVMFSGLTDIGMLFVRCGNDGISHSPLETITAEDASIAVHVLLDFLTNFDAAM
jgi:beta-ureidopropionase / N-carbamoyl-L-amino-acid hydrolase